MWGPADVMCVTMKAESDPPPASILLAELDLYQVWRRSTELTFQEQVRHELARFAGLLNIAHVCPIRRGGLSPQDFSYTAELMAEGESVGEELVHRLLDSEGRLRRPDPPGIVA